MNDDLDKVISSIENLEYKSKYNSKNRFQLLFVHSMVGIGAGGLLIVNGYPVTFQGVLSNSYMEFFIGFVPFMGGLFLLIGLLLNRHLLLEAVGMALLLIWDLWMVYCIWWTTENVPNTVYYPLFVYGGLAAFMCVHLGTLYKFVDRRAFVGHR